MTRLRMLWWLIGWLLVAATFGLSLARLEVDLSGGSDKWAHLLTYGTLMLWFGMLRSVRAPVALALVAMGVLIEFLQGQTGYRSFDVQDMLANTAGVLLGWAAVLTPLGGMLGWLESRLAGR